MSLRESRRMKERRMIIPFGDIMLPVIGLVAVGLLIVGTKLFFFSDDRGGPRYVPTQQAEMRQERESPPSSPITKTEEIAEKSPGVLAVPLGAPEKTTVAAPAPAQKKEPIQKKEPVSQPKPTDTPVKKAPQPKAVPVTEPKKTTTVQTKASPSPTPSAQSTWGVQIGSFSTSDGAETVSAEAKKKGYSTLITSAEVNGKTFYRVTVPAGMNKSDADGLSRKLEKDGFPVLPVRMR